MCACVRALVCVITHTADEVSQLLWLWWWRPVQDVDEVRAGTVTWCRHPEPGLLQRQGTSDPNHGRTHGGPQQTVFLSSNPSQSKVSLTASQRQADVSDLFRDRLGHFPCALWCVSSPGHPLLWFLGSVIFRLQRQRRGKVTRSIISE